ncbi:terpene synthase family protein [Metarhizium album ARSEF 1941]|uniref:Terpene synthase family protein n=1 Tax=Metarhizium album (strain ARSEF 1941) TaxID=1081103 RepID=A0A0B2WL59_METAS|nr:terpene synthase family protein [Metarhizium album ARSEF 1941]KHN93735.1 terpene synthase family protein [Metarhizium album ARSEF 1941]
MYPLKAAHSRTRDGPVEEESRAVTYNIGDMTLQHDQLAADAIALIQRAWAGYDETWGTGSMSCAVYDTAWISMVAKERAGEKIWLFPQSFDYLLSMQSNDGSWGATTSASQIDGILNTAASLLSLQRHCCEPLNTTSHVIAGIQGRIHRATLSLASQLNSWDVAATTHVGFELIVPELLELLTMQDPSIAFDFSGEKLLKEIHRAKMSAFVPDSLYGCKPSTALHSLEAFRGKLDFDKIAHHKVGGSMMASPSSTAAYLMYTTEWDNEAEAYLCNVVQAGMGRGSGAVPSAFPSMFFEYTWILSTLFRAGFSCAETHCAELDAMTGLLRDAFQDGKGTIGFAPGLPVDVDDTAKYITCLSRLGREQEACPDAMIGTFEADTHFRTYLSERDPSFTANCNVLSALLEQPDVSQYSSQIFKVVNFLCDRWWESDKGIKDKWNLSCLYPSLLVVQAFVDLLVQLQRGNLKPLRRDVQSRVHITLFQACLRALLCDSDSTSVEQAAYRVLILCEARRLSFFDTIRPRIDEYIKDQASLLNTTPNSELESEANRVWIEKVSFGSPLITQGYRLAALKAASLPVGMIGLESNHHSMPSLEGGGKYVKLLKRTPLFARTPEWKIEVSALEASLFQPLLRRRRLDVFPRTNMAPDKYFDIIPLTWTSCNNRTGIFASTRFIYEMMVISFLDFQADEFMEAVAGRSFHGDTGALRQLIDDVFMAVGGDKPARMSNKRKTTSDGTREPPKTSRRGVAYITSNEFDHTTTSSRLECKDNKDQVRQTLTRFVSHIAQHPLVQSASPCDRNSTLRELRVYLHAHVTQSEDNASLIQARGSSWQPRMGTAGFTRTLGSDSYFRWVHTVSSDHTACPYSFAFAGCLLSAQLGGVESFPSTRAKYLATAACQHLATMCRMYNDYGSVARDEAECNLNSVDFPEFANDSGADLESRKKTLYELAQYERDWFEDAMSRLGTEMRHVGRSRQLEVWSMFCDVTDLYGQIYVVKDIASRMVNGGGTRKS